MSDNYKPRKGNQGDKVIICGDCGTEVERKGLFDQKATMVVHCEGSKNAYGCLDHLPHHTTRVWDRCWKCAGYMGCAYCVPTGYKDGLCKPCRVKTTLESLLNGGPVSAHYMSQGNDKLEWGTIKNRPTPALADYPKEWVRKYAEQCYRSGMSADGDDTGEWKECRKAFMDFRLAAIPRPKGRLALQRERNKQVAALTD